ncbi:bifunctional adenosylcobinamide kinase/adenosylcobinamide-phosphate guanylyltransferase [Sedimentitalea todarodis]|uniref:Bifunctional adenosylcobalamin biosynthesis protein n=1 Tax=Sedimentitalea todarodis TaxID=1631240 RepID=A0ABU3VFP2_9RHOB|nr:bifunctional adenosylcobinamide kinase/adenosylcobinamide-phosphate guanylyltransferase [Sedimentitalea todarodis]MDU9005001.1 bifunctional adenosylcobinamide kinase/adenosylcobinamide-phosphate guanylyltransferase [Sedimentitalea todarodis]
MQSRHILVLGGAASGKSAFAETLAEKSGKPLIYLATALAFDPEMRHKIDRHIARRGDVWTTVEAPLDLVPALGSLSSRQGCLLDCATMWLSNLMLAEKDINSAQTALIDAIRACAAELVIVSNEVGQGIVPENSLARRFRDAQGRLNIALAAECDIVVQVIAGLPRVLKGSLE